MTSESNDQDTDFGILTAPVNGKGTWGALKALRASLRDLGSATEVIFIDALDGEGRAVSLHDPRVAALVLGYKLSPRSAVRS